MCAGGWRRSFGEGLKGGDQFGVCGLPVGRHVHQVGAADPGEVEVQLAVEAVVVDGDPAGDGGAVLVGDEGVVVGD